MREDDQIELAWAAGFFDGEGSICCTSNNGKPFRKVQLSVGQKNDGDSIAETLLRFQRAMGVGHIYLKAHHSRDANQHQFLACSLSDVRVCVKRLWPYLSSRKREQIMAVADKFWSTTGKEVIT